MAAVPEDEKAGSLQRCRQTWGSLAGHVEPRPLDNGEWERLCVVITDSADRKTTNESLTQSIRFPLCTQANIQMRKSSEFTRALPCLFHPVVIPCDNLPNYLLGISLKCDDDLLRQWLKYVMRKFLISFSRFLFFHCSMALLLSEWLSLQVILSG